ncbi:hypothetical protein P171DRAFT_468009 [Karstenula rhodostoma CBS 690.94]|uniref:Uncharacterized protein n=1 Tax=Karstenula rhodostoma CBS 690.94 TaxID=1392251 RepID=A0A9P4UGT6_9PLEO|nr:hypothetical protein P171DRAFT_468009 [Karstenula rhodostoma CBS 690.94]
MFPSLQPHRPQPPQQPARPSCAHQQIRAAHATPPPSAPSQAPGHTPTAAPQLKPRSQIEAMPPFSSHPLVPPRSVYDSAVRHPVFFTEQLRKPPFPIPTAATHGWNPVASGYIFEQRRAEANGIPKTKL